MGREAWTSRQARPPDSILEEAEGALIQTLLFLDRCGFPLGQKQVRVVAEQMTNDPKIKARFSTKGPTRHWFRGFFKRRMEQYPALLMASKRSTDCKTTKWFNSEMVNWWYTNFERIVVEEGFAQRNAEGQLEWIDPSRVILTDETCVSGGGTRKGTSGKSKVLTLKSKCTQSDKGKGHYRRVPEGRDYDEHVTLIAGCIANGCIAPPAWLFTSGPQGLRAGTMRQIQEAAPTLPRINGREMGGAIVGTGPNGGVTGDNIKEIMEKVFRAACPNFTNEPGKKILWLTDAGPGRLDQEFVSWMRQNGIVMVHWLA
jgi:hypothetical protein